MIAAAATLTILSMVLACWPMFTILRKGMEP